MKYLTNLIQYLLFSVLIINLTFAQDTTLTVTADGNVGIGTTGPVAKFHVVSGGDFSSPQIELQQTGNLAFTNIRFRNQSNQFWDIAESPGNQLRFYSGTFGEDILTMTAAGNIGIGLLDPSHKLVISGHTRITESNRLMLGGPFSQEYLYNPDGSSFRIHVGSGDRISISNSGNVGIGTIAPAQKLHVDGSLQLDKTGPELGRLILNTVSQGDPGRYGIQFSNNTLAPFLGDDIGNQYFDFYSVWGANRTYDAAIQIHGKASGSWGNFLKLTHDGSDGSISTDVGNIIITPGGGAIDVNGAIYQRGNELHADYVFKDDYQLESIEEHAAFMWQEKHLKAIPKAAVDENGLEIVEVGAHRKGIVEELEKAHIYIDQLNERIKMLEEKLEKMAANQN